MIYDEAGENANVVFGALIDESMKNELSVTVIATGFDASAADKPIGEEPLPKNALPEFKSPVIIEPEVQQTEQEKEQMGMFEGHKVPDPAKVRAEIPVFGEHQPLEETFHPLEEGQKNDMNIPAYLRQMFKRR
jgi:cell division protein FtsZ